MKVYLTLILTIFMVGACQTGTKEQPTEGPTTNEKPAAEKPVETASFASPTDALKGFVEAVKAKDDKKVRATLSEADNKALDSMVAKFDDKEANIFKIKDIFDQDITMPEMKDEKVDGEKATIQVKEAKDEKWEAMNFVKENDSWKLDLGFTELAKVWKPEAEGEDKPKAKSKDEAESEKKKENSEKSSEPSSTESFSDAK